MFKTTVNNGPEKFWLQQEVPEARAVDGDVGALDLLFSCWSCALRGSLGLLVLFVIQKLIVDVVLGHCVCLNHSRQKQEVLQPFSLRSARRLLR